MRLTHFGILSSTLFALAGCLSNTPTRTLSGGANDPVAAAQREALGLGDMAVEDAGSLPALTATSLTLGTALPLTSGGTGATNASGARTALGATATGTALFTATDAAAARTAVGASATGSALITAVDAAAARNTLAVSGTSGSFTRTCSANTVTAGNAQVLAGTIIGFSCFILSGTETLTLATGSASGQRLTLIAGAVSSLILTDVSVDPGPYLTANWNPGENDTIELLWTGSAWVELHRSDN